MISAVYAKKFINLKIWKNLKNLKNFEKIIKTDEIWFDLRIRPIWESNMIQYENLRSGIKKVIKEAVES